MTALWVALGLAWAVIAALCVVVLALARQVGVLHQRVAPAGALLSTQGPRTGEHPPQISAASLDGTLHGLGGTHSLDRPLLTLFVSPDCPLCKRLLPIVDHFARAERIDVLIAGDDEAARLNLLADTYAIARDRFINSSELGRIWGVDKLPHAVLLDHEGRIVGRGLVNSREHLESLIVSLETGHRSIQQWRDAEAA